MYVSGELREYLGDRGQVHIPCGTHSGHRMPRGIATRGPLDEGAKLGKLRAVFFDKRKWTRALGGVLLLTFVLGGMASSLHTHFSVLDEGSSWQVSTASTQTTVAEVNHCGFCQAGRRFELETPPGELNHWSPRGTLAKYCACGAKSPTEQIALRSVRERAPPAQA